MTFNHILASLKKCTLQNYIFLIYMQILMILGGISFSKMF